MSYLKPKLFSVIKNYSKEQLIKDVVSGIIVAIIALPLSIALAIASGVGPEKGIYTAIVAGFIISFLGGSRVQISGPTAAFATTIAGIVLTKGMDALVMASIMAGIILVIMGVFKMGTLIKFIPFTITTGFTAGIAVTLFIGQIKDFLGLTLNNEEPLIEALDKLKYDIKCINTFNWQAFVVGMVSLLILVLWPMIKRPKFLAKIPPSLIAVIVGILMVKLINMNVATIGSAFGGISNELPKFTAPKLSFSLAREMLPSAFTIAVLAAIESLLSCVVSDTMINSRHNSNAELVAQGVGNVASALFGGIPATGAIARTAANVKNGGRTPISGMVHSVTLLLILVVLMPYAALIPMPTIAAILFVVAYNMSGWRTFVNLCKSAPKSDIAVLFATFVLTVVFDLVIAIEIGMLLACVLFIKRMSEQTLVQGWKLVDDENDPDSISLRKVPANTMVYEISGPMFFGAADKILGITVKEDMENLVLRMRSVNSIDYTAVNSLTTLQKNCEKNGVRLILSHVNEQPMSVLKKSGLFDKIGEENFCEHIDAALLRAEQ
ncbi:MAG: SulP family inorganic anion transporter [Lachnospiraceae bacterium]|nr:SulP family inorganic anion transporter [Lachnospiraceae bacterium]